MNRGRGRGGFGRPEQPRIAGPRERFPQMMPIIPTFDQDLLKETQHMQEIIEWCVQSPFYPVKPAPKKDLERYSDIYNVPDAPKDPLESLLADASFFPDELLSRKQRITTAATGKVDLLKAFRAAQDAANATGNKDQTVAATEELEEEQPESSEGEEENDYIESYFDNGEDYEEYDGGDDEGGVF